MIFVALPVSGDSDVEFELGGDVETRCTIESTSTVEADFTSRDEASISYELYCNTEMSISLTSANGGLLNGSRDGGADERGSPLLHTYTATLSLQNAGLERSFTSGEMRDTVQIDVTGQIVFDEVGRIDVRLDEGLTGSYSGSYRDRVTIAVFPSLATALN